MSNVIANNIQVGELFRQYQLSKILAVIVQSLQGHLQEKQVVTLEPFSLFQDQCVF